MLSSDVRKSKKVVKVISCFCACVIILVAIILPIVLNRLGYFEYKKNGKNYFKNNPKYDVEYILDDRKYDFEIAEQKFDYSKDISIDGMLFKMRIYTADDLEFLQNHLFYIEFSANIVFKGGVIATANPLSWDDFFYKSENYLIVEAKNDSGVVRSMRQRGASSNDNTKELFSYSHKGDDMQQYFGSGNFVITISNILIYKYTRK